MNNSQYKFISKSRFTIKRTKQMLISSFSHETQHKQTVEEARNSAFSRLSGSGVSDSHLTSGSFGSSGFGSGGFGGHSSFGGGFGQGG